MKKLNFLFIALLFVFASCSKDDDDVEVNLSGTWEVSEVEYEGDYTMEYEGFPITIPFTAYGKDIDAQVAITENPNLINSSGSYTAVFTASFMGQTQTEEVPVDFGEFFQNTAWTQNGNTLVLTHTDGTVQNVQITSLTNNKMVLVGNETESFDGNEVDVKATYTLIR